MVVIVDYGLGNLASISNMLKKIGADSVISSDPELIAAAERLILPGVGNFFKGMENLEKSGLLPALNQAVLIKKTPILGICLGMQLMTNSSEEGNCKGLGWIDAETIRFRFKDSALNIPHMGWNKVEFTNVFFRDNTRQFSKFYFVHSYHVVANSPENILATSVYGKEFHSGIIHENIIGVQFHPEKSHQHGIQFLTKFISFKA